ncbi:DNA repair protein RecN [Trichothermofontia sp.]
MLLSLRIENFALIDRLELAFGKGLNVLTGETGAGKSIILDAIAAILGDKVTPRVIRTGATRSLLEASFQVTPALADWLTAQAIEPMEDGTLICSRELAIAATGLRSRSRVNGVLVNRQQLDTLREHLVEITAQGQTSQLGQPAIQRQLLDSFGGPDLDHQRQQVATVFADYQHALRALETRRQSQQQRLQRLDLLQYQAQELATAQLRGPQELAELEQERQRLGHSVELKQQSYAVYQALYQNEQGGTAAADLLGQAETILTNMHTYDAQLASILELVSSALTQVAEAGRQINAYGSFLETDPDRLQTVEARIQELKLICRKYGPTLDDAIAYAERITRELEELTAAGETLEALEAACQAQQQRLERACAVLTQLRQATAQHLEATLVAELKPLAMERVQFQVVLTPTSPTATGADRVGFHFSPNPGEPLQPLAETASGGEMSRFLLALKAVLTQGSASLTPVLVFDEIDVGVSGRVAQAIAHKLHQLAQQQQVLCVTHQPIVAAMADHHFRVEKQVVTLADQDAQTPTAERTIIRVQALDPAQRRQELAQLAGGEVGSDGQGSATAFADLLLSQATSLRQLPAATDLAPAPPASPSSRAQPSTRQRNTPRSGRKSSNRQRA